MRGVHCRTETAELKYERLLVLRSSDKVLVLTACCSKWYMVNFCMKLVPEMKLSREQLRSIIFYEQKGNFSADECLCDDYVTVYDSMPFSYVP